MLMLSLSVSLNPSVPLSAVRSNVSPGLALPKTTYTLVPSPSAMSSYWSSLNLPRFGGFTNAGLLKPVKETPSPLANGRVTLAGKVVLPNSMYRPVWLPRPANSMSAMLSPLKSAAVMK